MRFQKFRIEDVRDQFFYACLFQTVTLAWRAVSIIQGLNSNFKLLLGFQLIITSLYWSLYLLRNRLKDRFMAGHIGLTAIYYVLLLTVTELNDHPELTTFEWGRQFMLGTVATNLLLLTPSISYGCFLYLPFHYLSILIMTIRDDVEKG